jgi:hypothetical protein
MSSRAPVQEHVGRKAQDAFDRRIPDSIGRIGYISYQAAYLARVRDRAGGCFR